MMWPLADLCDWFWRRQRKLDLIYLQATAAARALSYEWGIDHCRREIERERERGRERKGERKSERERKREE